MKIKITNKLTKKQFSQALNIFIKFFPIKNKKKPELIILNFILLTH